MITIKSHYEVVNVEIDDIEYQRIYVPDKNQLSWGSDFKDYVYDNKQQSWFEYSKRRNKYTKLETCWIEDEYNKYKRYSKIKNLLKED